MNDKSGPKAALETPAKKSIPTVAEIGAKSTTGHGALLAESARPWFDVLAWRQAVERAARDGEPFTADTLRDRFDLPDIGSAVGGIFMRARRAGLIRRVGYQPSTRASRAGGVVAVWVGGRR